MPNGDAAYQRRTDGERVSRIIDVHGYDYPDEYLAAVTHRASGFEHFVRDDGRLVLLQNGAVAAGIPRPRLTASERLALMDDVGIAMQVLPLPATFPTANRAEVMRESNDSLVHEADGSSGRFRVFARLPLTDVGAAIAEFDRVSRFS